MLAPPTPSGIAAERVYAPFPVAVAEVPHPLAPTYWWLAVPPQDGGVKWYDLVGFNHGTLTRMANRSTAGWARNQRPGSIGPPLLFDGAVSPNGDYIKLPIAFTTSGNLTVAGWFNMSATSAIIGLYFASSTASGGHVLFGRSSTEGTFLASCSATPANNLKYNATATANTWYHVMITKSSSAITALFINGVTASTAATTFFTCNNVNHLIGGDHLTTEGDFPWAGWIDDVVVWQNVQLTGVQMRAWYEESRLGYPNVLRREGRKVEPAAAAATFLAAWAAQSNRGTGFEQIVTVN